MNKTLIMFVALSTLIGCSSIEQPIARLPLVEKSQHHSPNLVTTQFGLLLDNTESEETVRLNNQLYSAFPTFYAASGHFCRYLSSGDAKKLFCKSAIDGWFEVPAVLSDIQTRQTGGIE